MTTPAWIALVTTIAVFMALQLQRRVPADVLFISGAIFLALCGIISPSEALAGFSNNAILTIVGLMTCAAGLRRAGVLDWVGQRLLGPARTERAARNRLSCVLGFVSAFLLNTAVVIMFMPVVLDWCRRHQITPSRLLLPLSYLVILGGVCTLVGTSTTLVLNGKLGEIYQSRLSQFQADQAPPGAPQIERPTSELPPELRALRPMSLFEISWIGVPCAILGTIVLLLTAPYLLPDRQEISEQFDLLRREYLAEMLVRPDCSLAGKTVEGAGLRHLPGLFLIEIIRGRESLTPVSPLDVVLAGDRLIFSGVVSTLVDLESIPGLVPVADPGFDDDQATRPRRRLTEVVLSPSCPLIGTTVRDGSFRQRYNAAIVALHRDGVRVTNKIGNIVLAPGDTLLLQTRSDFAKTYRESRDFYLVSDVEGFTPRRHEKAITAAVLGGLLVVWLCLTSYVPSDGVASGLSSTALATITIGLAMVATRCLTAADARAAIDVPLVITIAGALGLAKGLETTGAADSMARGLVDVLGGGHPWLLLCAVYVLTALFTEVITNNAVAVTMLPIAIGVAIQSHHSPRPFILVVAIAASLSFLSPVGYQTNLMVMTPGGYRPSDYLRVGAPVALTVMITTLVGVRWLWPF